MTIPAARPEAAVPAALRVAVGLARHAPSPHNSQPWSWRVIGDTAELSTDPRRSLPVADPSGRKTMLGCGATLHHARTALAAAGWGTRVTLLPDPTRPNLLARIEVAGRQGPDEAAVRMAGAITRRLTDRYPFRGYALPAHTVAALRSAVEQEGCRLTVLTSEDGRIEPAAEPGVNQRPGWAILYTDGDSRADRLRAGQAMSALLLTATDFGVAIGVQSVDVAAVRTQLDGHVPHARCHEQLVLSLDRPDLTAPFRPR